MNEKTNCSSESALLESVEESSEETAAIETTIASLQSDARRLWEAYKDDEYFRDNLFMIAEVERAAPAWTLITRKVKTAEANRKLSMLTGPFFACEEYPWPSDNGMPMASLVQLDLRVASKLRQLPLGDGLLQVFIRPDAGNWEVRSIPRQVVETAALTELPTFDENQFSSTSLEWASESGEFDEIVALSNPVISSTAVFDGGSMPDNLLDEVLPFVERMNGHAGNTYGPPRLFGTFDLIQYCPSERPPSLMCLGIDDNFTWGGAGSAQIFYEVGENGVEFTFEWSC